jgi:hypothetical protein
VTGEVDRLRVVGEAVVRDRLSKTVPMTWNADGTLGPANGIHSAHAARLRVIAVPNQELPPHRQARALAKSRRRVARY